MSEPARAEPRIGTAGWSIPRQHAAAFPASGSHLERYAQRFNAVEINSSFYRPHRRATYAALGRVGAERLRVRREGAAKRSRTTLRLVGAEAALETFLDQATGLGDKLGVLLFQLPPSFAFDAGSRARFFAALRARHDGAVVCEPRHASWFTPRAEAIADEARNRARGRRPGGGAGGRDAGGWHGVALLPPARLAADVSLQLRSRTAIAQLCASA